jgi:hypothetical protein
MPNDPNQCEAMIITDIGERIVRKLLCGAGKPGISSSSFVATNGHGEGATHGPHLMGGELSQEPFQSSLLDGLNMVEIHRGRMLQPLVGSHHNLARRAPDGRSDRSDHDGVEKRNHFRA